jgi:hypothetical protein
LKTKFLLGAIVVAVLAVFGVIGLQQSPTTEAANVTGISGCNGTTVAIATTCDFTISYFDDWSASSGVQATATGGTLSSVSTTCTAGAISSNAGLTQIFQSTDGTAATNCDTGTTSEAYTWTIRYTCNTIGTNTLTVTAPTALAGASVGSISPGVPTNGSGAMTITCVQSLPGGNSTLTIRKVDQYGQPLTASFSIQASPFWVEVARVNLGSTTAYNPCATDGTQGTFNISGAGALCSQTGVITPSIFASGLPAGQYRVVEVAGPSSTCTLVQVYNGNQAQNQSGVLPYSGSLLTQPVTLNLPDANILDLQLTFVNSCVVAGGPSTATSQIAVVIGGSTAGLVNTSNIEITPAPLG